MDFILLLFNSHLITDYNLFATINLGILAIATLVFGFSTIRKEVKDNLKGLNKDIKNEKPQRKDFIKTTLNKEIQKLEKDLESIGNFFRKCIYFNILSLFFIIVNQFLSFGILDAFIILFIVFSSVIIGINVHRFKRIYNFDVNKKIDELRASLDLLDGLGITKNYGLIYEIVEKNKN